MGQSNEAFMELVKHADSLYREPCPTREREATEEEVALLEERWARVEAQNIRVLGYPKKAQLSLVRERRRWTLGVILTFWPTYAVPILLGFLWLERLMDPYPGWSLATLLVMGILACVGTRAVLTWGPHEIAFWQKLGRPLFTEEEVWSCARDMYRAEIAQVIAEKGLPLELEFR